MLMVLISWGLIGLLSGTLATYWDWLKGGDIKVGDVLAIFIASIFGPVATIFILCYYSDKIVLIKGKKQDD